MSQHDSIDHGPLVEGARSVQTAAADLADGVATFARDRLEGSRDYVVENPVTSALLVAGAGLLVGYLLGRPSA